MKRDTFGASIFFDECIGSNHLRAFSSGYEQDAFRYEQLADLLFDALPDFALSHKEKASLSSFNMVAKLRKAARAVYATEKYKSRGEFGELLLHLIMVDFYKTVPAISKLYYKDGPNETVKGFDAVHVVPTSSHLELWLGETKFYESAWHAIADVAEELNKHTEAKYLRSEFLFIANKIEDDWPHAQQLRLLIDEKTSLDKVFPQMRIPVLITYDSPTVKKHKKSCDAYLEELRNEIHRHHAMFRAKNLPKNIDLIVLFVPLDEKAKLVESLHGKLRAAQNL